MKSCPYPLSTYFPTFWARGDHSGQDPLSKGPPATLSPGLARVTGDGSAGGSSELDAAQALSSAGSAAQGVGWGWKLPHSGTRGTGTAPGHLPALQPAPPATASPSILPARAASPGWARLICQGLLPPLSLPWQRERGTRTADKQLISSLLQQSPE